MPLDTAALDRWLTTPPEPIASLDEQATACPGVDDDGNPCEERHTCDWCGGIVCTEHDEVPQCPTGPVHESCHDDCLEPECVRAVREDDLLERAEAQRGYDREGW